MIRGVSENSSFGRDWGGLIGDCEYRDAEPTMFSQCLVNSDLAGSKLAVWSYKGSWEHLD